MKTRLLGGLAALTLMATAGGASAHSPFLAPNLYDATDHDHVTVQAFFGEHYFAPEVVMKSDDFHATGPDGRKIAASPTYLRDIALFEIPTEADGTYRISSGIRTGRVSKAHLVKGVWEFIEPGKPAPADAVDMQSVTRSEVYISRGKPNDTALAATGKGIEFHALTHPNDIYVGKDARFELLVDGKPVPNQPIELHRAEESYYDGLKGKTLTTDAAGRFSVNVATPGVWSLLTRYRTDSVGGAPAQSLSYQLGFEAIQ